MQAIEYHGNQTIKYVNDRKEPTITHPHDVKIKIKYSGICGSDLHEFVEGPEIFKKSHTHPEGQVMGHEFSGEIVDMGPEVSNLKLGQHVVVEANGTCRDRPDIEGECDACSQGLYNCCENLTFYGLGFRDGGMAEYCVVKDNHVVPYPNEIIPDDVAALIEPLAVGWHGVTTSDIVDEPNKDTCALIIGGGTIGLSTVFALRSHGIKNIVLTEPSETRRDLASKLGVKVFDPSPFKDVESTAQELRKLSHDDAGFDRVYDCAGTRETFRTMLSSLKTGGVATDIAHRAHTNFNVCPVHSMAHEYTLIGSQSYRREDLDSVLNAFKSGEYDPREIQMLITEKKKLSDAVDTFAELSANKDANVSVLLQP
ncbi:uncharacterized protein J8A68_000655 [[Candida] subhashii]|uniref:Enoyl reductase (ER) domain-containing protein n=1 Tax=[Candida] subhashii TaxID=561895 RepID=A0A8J5R6L5_9ASCO|nr:uncharacterized protein J8A68_000655 [[Candida] subhashii]KAG7665830.1 hypothetical protein J8A68_000655 [[Candida] subhashii]